MERARRISCVKSDADKQLLVKSHILSKVRYIITGANIRERQCFRNKLSQVIKKAFKIGKQVSRIATEQCLYGDYRLIDILRKVRPNNHLEGHEERNEIWKNCEWVKRVEEKYQISGRTDFNFVLI